MHYLILRGDSRYFTRTRIGIAGTMQMPSPAPGKLKDYVEFGGRPQQACQFTGGWRLTSGEAGAKVPDLVYP